VVSASRRTVRSTWSKKDEQGKPLLVLGQLGDRRGLIVTEGGTERLFVGVQPDFQGLGIWDGHRIERGVFSIVNGIEDVTLRNPDGKIVFEQP
jgi:hypothetical protein